MARLVSIAYLAVFRLSLPKKTTILYMTFSIITIVYNGESLIEGTIKSVLNQTHKDIEYIIIDGKSSDKTVEIAQNLTQKTCLKTKIVSEKDKGLYVAMNKGLAQATGDFLLFLNCGDHLFEPTTLEKIVHQATPDTQILFGETMLVDENRTHIGTRSAITVQKLPEKLTWQSMRYGMLVCHQSFLVRRSLPPPQYIEQNLAADIDWVIKCLKNADNVRNTHTIISEYLMGGVSKKQHRQSLKDRYAVLKTHFGFFPNIFAHIAITVRAAIFNIMGKKRY